VKAIAKRLRRLEGRYALADGPREVFRLVVRHLGPAEDFERAICRRTLWPNGTVCEIVQLGTGHPESDLTGEKLEEWIAGFPVEST